MTAEEHNKTLATLYFVYGAMHGLTLFGLMILGLLFRFASNAGELISTLWMGIATVAFIIFALAVALLPLLTALGFAKHRSWVKPLGITIAIVSLVNIPIGTALGIYTLKFFRSEAGRILYGGQAATTSDEELVGAIAGARPLMNFADRFK